MTVTVTVAVTCKAHSLPVGVSMAVAGLALVLVLVGVLPPLLLREPVGAHVAVDPRCVVETLALQEVGIGCEGRTDVGVAIADTPPAHGDLFDGVVVLEKRVQRYFLMFPITQPCSAHIKLLIYLYLAIVEMKSLNFLQQP